MTESSTENSKASLGSPYWCTKCRRNHKATSKIGIEHIEYCSPDTLMQGEVGRLYMEYKKRTVTPEPEEVSSQGDQEQGLNPSFEPSPAPAVGATPKGDGDLDSSEMTPQIESPGSEATPKGELKDTSEAAASRSTVLSQDVSSPGSEALSWPEHVMKQIQTLSENDAIISQRLDQLQGTMYEATQSAENPGPSWDFDEFPEWLKKPAIKFLGDLGAATRAFAGDQSQSEDEQVVRAAVTLMREEAKTRIATRAAGIAKAMADPGVEVYTRKKPEKKIDPKDAKKLE